MNACYKTMKVFFGLACMSTCCWRPKPKYEPFINHNKGTLKHHFDESSKLLVCKSNIVLPYSVYSNYSNCYFYLCTEHIKCSIQNIQVIYHFVVWRKFHNEN